MTPARKHFERTLAQREAAARGAAASTGGRDTPAATSAAMPLSDRMLITLRGHKAALKGIQSRVKKAEAKAGFLPDYDAYVEGILAADSGGQDTVLVTVMLWRIDAGLYAQAMEIAAYAVRHALAMPEQFARDLPTTLIEELAEHALADPENADLRFALDFALDLVADVDMPDEVRAKGLKSLGLMLVDDDKDRAAGLLDAALRLDPKCGVKTELGRLRKALDAAAAADAGADTGTEAETGADTSTKAETGTEASAGDTSTTDTGAQPQDEAPAKGGKTAARTKTAGAAG